VRFVGVKGGFDKWAGLRYNMDAEVRIAQGCFVFSQRIIHKPIALHLWVNSPASFTRTRVLPSGFSTVGSVDSAGLFAYKEQLTMIRRIQGFEGFILYYDCESKKCIVTIRDAADANQEYLENIANLCDAHHYEIDIVGRFIDAGKKWDYVSDDDLRLILDFWAASDWLKQSVKQELESRRQARMGYVYLLKADNGLYKIGQSKVIDERIKQLGLKLPYELELVLTIESEFYKEIEAAFHESLADKQVKGEWFRLNAEDIEAIKKAGAIA